MFINNPDRAFARPEFMHKTPMARSVMLKATG
jgi:hypothetical protein